MTVCRPGHADSVANPPAKFYYSLYGLGMKDPRRKGKFSVFFFFVFDFFGLDLERDVELKKNTGNPAGDWFSMIGMIMVMFIVV